MAKKATLTALTQAERDIILAALRLWQETKVIHVELGGIATNGGQHPALTDDEIDRLCEEKINE